MPQALTAKQRRKHKQIIRTKGIAAGDEYLAKVQRAGNGAPKSRQGRRPARVTVPVFGVPECAAEFGRLIANPFVASHNACLPLYPSPPSLKMTAWSKTVFQVGTIKFGAALFSPLAAIASDHTNGSMTVTTNGYTLAAVPTPGDANTTAVQSNSPYVMADIGSGDTQLQYRVVAAGLRVRYGGNAFQEGGELVGYSHPDHRTLAGTNVSEMLLGDGVHLLKATSNAGWHEITWVPKSGEYFTNIGSSHSMCFAWYNGSGVAGNTMQVESYAHFEVVGIKALGKTRSTPAVQQAAAVMDVASSNSGATTFQGRAEAVASALDGATSVITSAMGTAAAAATAYVGAQKIKSYVRGDRLLRNEL